MNDILWTSVKVTDFKTFYTPSEDEEKVLEAWSKNWSPAKTAQVYGMSEATVYRHRQKLRQVYNQVKKYSPILSE